MNRQQRRIASKQKVSEINSIRKEALQNAQKQLNDKRVEAMMFCFALALNKELGFDSPEQIMPILAKTDEYMAYWLSGDETLESLRVKTRDATGVDVKC